MKNTPGLTRGKRGAFEYRQRVPLDLVALFRRRSFSSYIGHVPPREAERQARQLRTRFDQLISEARALDPGTRVEASRIGFEKWRAINRAGDRFILAAASVTGPAFDANAPRHVQALQLLDAHELQTAANAARTRQRTPAPSASFDALLDRWQRRTNPRSRGTITQTKLWVERFRQITGRKDVRAVSLADVVAFRDAIEAAADAGEFTRETARHGFLRMQRLFSVAVADGVLASNPFAGVRVVVPSPIEPDPPRGFTNAQVAAILSGLDALPRVDHRWLIRLPLFTAARVGDLVNVHSADVAPVDGVMCIDINARRPGASLKTRNAWRVVPIPSAVADFATFAHEQSGQVFAGKSSRAVALFFQRVGNQYLREVAGGTAHELRHTAINRLRAAGVAEHIIAAIAGHSGGRSVTASYGRGVDVRTMADALERITY